MRSTDALELLLGLLQAQLDAMNLAISKTDPQTRYSAHMRRTASFLLDAKVTLMRAQIRLNEQAELWPVTSNLEEFVASYLRSHSTDPAQLEKSGTYLAIGAKLD